MHKLIKIINSKILNKKAPSSSSSTTSQSMGKIDRVTLNFPFRRDKLKHQKTTLESFQNYQQNSGQYILATSNFQGTEFVIRDKKKENCLNKHQEMKLQQKDKQHPKQANQTKQYKKQPPEQQWLQQPYKQYQQQEQQSSSQISIPFEVKQTFNSTIKQSSLLFTCFIVNILIEKLYIQKRRLLKQQPFEVNIRLSLSLLVVFFITLAIVAILGSNFLEFKDQNQTQHDQENMPEFHPLIFTSLSLIIIMSFISVLYVYFRRYQFFNFDYEVIGKMAKNLKEINKSYYNEKGYTIVCDIQMTWILLRSNKRSLNLLQNQRKNSD